jgi:5'-nucleotidase (lipoprotein e(P4) family)
MNRNLSLVTLFLVFVSFSSDKPFVSENDHLTMAVLYQQTAPEYRALCYQAYNLASVRIQQIVKRRGSGEGLAVVLDLDETVLDNSPYEAKCILDNISYPSMWKEWCDLGRADAVPGAVEFLNLVNSLGVQIVYISNRKEEVRRPTKENLASLGLPEVKDEHMLLRDSESAKESRRQTILKNYEIALLVGDNLNDFSEVFETTQGKDRMAKVDELKKSFAERFIVFPNPMYGEWETELYSEKVKTPQEKKAARYKALKGF